MHDFLVLMGRHVLEGIAPVGKIAVPRDINRAAPDAGDGVHDEDHVHVMFRAKPQSEISKFINAYKSASSRLLKKEFPQIRNKLWKEAFWSQSFCLLTSGGASTEVIREYIRTQGEKGNEKSVQIPDLSGS